MWGDLVSTAQCNNAWTGSTADCRFIPAAIVARPWDFEDPSSQLTPSPPMPCDEDLNIPLEVSSPDLSM